MSDNKNKIRRTAIAMCAVIMTTVAGAEEPPYRIDSLIAEDTSAGDRFGSAVAVSGDTAAVSSVASGENGAVYVFIRDASGWRQQARLELNNGDGFDPPGAIAVSGNTLVVGSPGSGVDPSSVEDAGRGEGRVYVFERSGSDWTQQAVLQPDASQTGKPFPAQFGMSVAVSRDTIVVSARDREGSSSAWTGTATVYVRDGTDWAVQQRLSNDDGNDSDLFGHAVLLDADTAVVSAPRDWKVPGPGAVYVFERSDTNWALQQKIESSSAPAGCYGNDLFGRALALSGDTLAIWDPRHDETCHDSTIDSTDTLIYVRESGKWSKQALIVGVKPRSLAGDLLSVSCSTPGRIEVYARSEGSWPLWAGINGDSEAGFGPQVLDRANLLVGAPFDATLGMDAGAATVFLLSRFYDVPPGYWAYPEIDSLAAHRITGGCGGGNYCPLTRITRAQLAVFLVRAKHGGHFIPPAATGNVYHDVTPATFAAAFIEQLDADGIASRCGDGRYCPNQSLTRAEIAVFLLRAKYGHDYLPPDATGDVFDDVELDTPNAAWIEQLSQDRITNGCDTGLYCPGRAVPRDEAAAFIVRTFGL